MICNIKSIQDYPDRGRCAGSKVIHATAGNNDVYITACNQRAYFRELTGFRILSDKPGITCKACLKVLESLSRQKSNVRYVLAHVKGNLFYNSNDGWVDSIDDATLYKETKRIEEIMNAYVYYKDGKIMDHWYWDNAIRDLRIRGADDSMIKSRFKRVKHPKKEYKMLKVIRRIEVIEE